MASLLLAADGASGVVLGKRHKANGSGGGEEREDDLPDPGYAVSGHA
jgi:hypothetical protein